MNHSKTQLHKIVGLGFGIAITIGGTIGTGILRKPGVVANYLGNVYWILGAWVLVSLYALGGVLCVTELATSVPRAGAWYVYAERAFGKKGGLLIGLTMWSGTVSATAFGAYTMSEYLALLVPSLGIYIVPIAITILLILGFLHLIGMALASRMQEGMSFLKAIGLIVFIGVAFLFSQENHFVQNIENSKHVNFSVLGFIFSLQAIFYTFDGWHTAAYFSEEDKDPAKNLPKSLFLSWVLIVFIYLLSNIAVLYALPLEIIKDSKLPFSNVIELVFGRASSQWVTFFLMISIVGILNAQLLFNPRVLYSMSKDKLLPAFLNNVNKGGTPKWALTVSVLASIGLILGGKKICEWLSDIATFFFLLSYLSGFLSVLIIRKNEPNLPRPWKTPWYPYLPWTMFLITLFFLVIAVYQYIDHSMLFLHQ